MKLTPSQWKHLGPIWQAAIEEWEKRKFIVSAAKKDKRIGDLYVIKSGIIIIVRQDCSLDMMQPRRRKEPAPGIAAADIVAKVNEWLREAEGTA